MRRIQILLALTLLLAAAKIQGNPETTAFIIVSTKEYKPKLHKLIKHKEDLHDTIMLILKEDYNDWNQAPTGIQCAIEIREILQGIHAQLKEQVSEFYVLFVGDPHYGHKEVPMMSIRFNGPSTSVYGCDMFFAELDGNWDMGSRNSTIPNGVYGEVPASYADTDSADYAKGGVNLTFEMYVGRFPVFADTENGKPNIKALEKMIDKTIAYENGEYDGDWLNCVQVSINENYYNGYFHGYGEYLRNEVIEAPNYIRRVYNAALNPAINDLEFGPHESKTWSITANMTAWGKRAGIKFAWNHGTLNKVNGVCYSPYGDNYYTDDPAALVEYGLNNQRMEFPTIFYSAACSNFNPTNPGSLGYHLIQDGCIAFVGNVATSYQGGGYDPTYTGMHGNTLGIRFVEYLLDYDIPIGAAFYEAKRSFCEIQVDNPYLPPCYMSAFDLYGMNLYGDPSVRYRRYYGTEPPFPVVNYIRDIRLAEGQTTTRLATSAILDDDLTVIEVDFKPHFVSAEQLATDQLLLTIAPEPNDAGEHIVRLKAVSTANKVSKREFRILVDPEPNPEYTGPPKSSGPAEADDRLPARGTFTLFNLLGQKVYSHAYESLQEPGLRASGLDNGIYIGAYTGEGRMITRKVFLRGE